MVPLQTYRKEHTVNATKSTPTTINPSGILLALLVVSQLLFALPSQANTDTTDPVPVVTNTGSAILLTKELYGATNRYGVADNAADVIDTGGSGTWSFNLPALGLSGTNYTSASVTLWLVLDDHYDVSTNLYSLQITIPGGTAFSGPAGQLGLAHGIPFSGTPFTNWTAATFSTSQVPDLFLVSLLNTGSSAPLDWIGVDKIQVALIPVPEPSSMRLLVIGLVLGFIGVIVVRKLYPGPKKLSSIGCATRGG